MEGSTDVDTELFDAIVVGAGWTGLATAAALLEPGLPPAVDAEQQQLLLPGGEAATANRETGWAGLVPSRRRFHADGPELLTQSNLILLV